MALGTLAARVRASATAVRLPPPSPAAGTPSRCFYATFRPEKVLGVHWDELDPLSTPKVRVQWEGFPPEWASFSTTWEDPDDMIEQYPEIDWGQAVYQQEKNITTEKSTSEASGKQLKKSTRARRASSNRSTPKSRVTKR